MILCSLTLSGGPAVYVGGWSSPAYSYGGKSGKTKGY